MQDNFSQITIQIETPLLEKAEDILKQNNITLQKAIELYLKTIIQNDNLDF